MSNRTRAPVRPTLQSLRAAIAEQPRDGRARCALAQALAEREDHAEALAAFDAATALAPASADVRARAAAYFATRGYVPRAAHEYRAAIACAPTRGDLWLALGRLVESHLLDRDEAERCFLEAIACAPHDLNGYVELSLFALPQARAAEASAVLAQRIGPCADRALIDRAVASALHELGRQDEAREACDAILRSTPDDRLARLVRAAVRTAVRDLEGAQQDFEDARARHPHDRVALWGLLNHLCRTGQWAEARRVFRATDRQRRATPHDVPEWTGRPGRGKRLLLLRRGGYGDVIQYTRFAEMLLARDLTVVAECQTPLVGLIRSIPGVSVVARPYDPIPDVACAINPAHVPMVIGDLDAWPGRNSGYMQVPSARATAWRRRLGRASARLRIGLVWAAGDTHSRDPYRSKAVPFDEVRVLADVPDVEIYSLQVGAAATALRTARRPAGIVDLGNHLRDFSDTAAAILCLDLIVSVDTAVAHLAGALGRPCWLMLSYLPCWRWGLEGTTTPWYTSLRLFRQSRPGDWPGVIRAVGLALREQTVQRAASP